MKKYYAVKTVSGVNSFRNCVIGTGESVIHALQDAYGYDESLAYCKKQANRANAWVEEIDAEEYFSLM